MSLIVTGAIVLVVVIVIYFITKKPKSKNPTILEMFSPNGSNWVNKMCEMYDTGETWTKSQVLLFEKTYGITLALNQYGQKTTAYEEAIGLKKEWRNAPESSAEYRAADFYDGLQLGLTLRSGYQYSPLTFKSEAEVMKEYGLNIGQNEVLYFHSIKIDWYEEKTVRTNVTYRGFSYRSGGPMSYRTGSFDVMQNHITDFVAIDRGELFVTNKRIIFIGKENRQNRTLDFKELLEFSIYKDGILLGKSNGRKPLILVPGYKNSLVPRDTLNWLIRVLERIISNTQDKDLTPKDFDVL